VGLAAKLSTMPLRKRVFGYTSPGGIVAVVIGRNRLNVRASSVERARWIVDGLPFGGKETTET
jgi:hypothetical protein